MKRFLVLLVIALTLWTSTAFSYSGLCGIWATKSGDFYSKNFSGDQTGYNAALAYVGSAGTIQVLPGCEGNITYGTVPDGVLVLTAANGKWIVRGTATVSRFGPASTATTGNAVRVIDGAVFAQSRTGVAAAVAEVVAAGGGLVFMPKGRYRWDQNVTLNNAVGVTIAGAGDSTILWGDYSTGDDCFRVTGTSSNIEFRNFAYDGDWATNTAGRGIDVEASTCYDVRVEGVTVMRTNDAAIASAAPRTVIRNCKIFQIGDAIDGDRIGIRLYGGTADSSRVENNDVRDCKNNSLLVDPSTDYVTIRGNRFVNAAGTGTTNAVLVCNSAGKFVDFTDNVVDGADNGVLALFGSDSTRVVGNVFTNGRIYSGLYFLRGAGVLVSNNICTYNIHQGIMVGFDQGNCSGFLIEGNLCANNQGAGILVNPSTTRTHTNIAIQNNACVSNGSYGIVTSGASVAGQTIFIGQNVLVGNTSGPASLATTNYTYAGARFEAGLLVRGPTNGKIDFDQTGVNQIVASHASGDLQIGARNDLDQLVFDNNGVTSTVNLTLGNALAYRIKDTGGTARSVLHTAGGTDILRISPLGSGQSIDVLNFAGSANVTFRDDGCFITKGYTFANLPTATGKNGGVLYCTDCKGPADAGWTAGMTAASGGTGSMVFGTNGTWKVP